jgi:hypothetical protein
MAQVQGEGVGRGQDFAQHHPLPKGCWEMGVVVWTKPKESCVTLATPQQRSQKVEQEVEQGVGHPNLLFLQAWRLENHPPCSLPSNPSQHCLCPISSFHLYQTMPPLLPALHPLPTPHGAAVPGKTVTSTAPFSWVYAQKKGIWSGEWEESVTQGGERHCGCGAALPSPSSPPQSLAGQVQVGHVEDTHALQEAHHGPTPTSPFSLPAGLPWRSRAVALEGTAGMGAQQGTSVASTQLQG